MSMRHSLRNFLLTLSYAHPAAVAVANRRRAFIWSPRAREVLEIGSSKGPTTLDVEMNEPETERSEF